MEPFLLKGVCKDYLWGGNKLKTRYGKITDVSPVAESWELSCHKDGLSVIASGKNEGMTLEQYIENNPSVLGEKASGELPILIKLIDAQNNLSVQVHPNNEQAKKWEGQNGKTEMWYVIDAEPDAKITFGVKNNISKEELKKSIENGTVEELLNSVPSHSGDVFFVKSGTIHAIGKGNLIAEIQQNSNVTYRLYDYMRKDKNGNLRELHIEKGILAADTQKSVPSEVKIIDENTRLLAQCEYFTVKEIKLNEGKYELCADKTSYHALINVGGSFRLDYPDGEIKLNPGDTVFVPSGMGKYTLAGSGKLLVTTN